MAIRDLHVSVSNATIYAAIDDKVAAWDAHTYKRIAARDVAITDASAHKDVTGVWSYDDTLWVARRGSKTIKAYTISTGSANTDKDFKFPVNNPAGMSATDTYLYIASESLLQSEDNMIYAFTLSEVKKDKADRTGYNSATNPDPDIRDSSQDFHAYTRARGVFTHKNRDDNWYVYVLPVARTDRLRAVAETGLPTTTTERTAESIFLLAQRTVCGFTALDLRDNALSPVWMSIHEIPNRISAWHTTRYWWSHTRIWHDYGLASRTALDLLFDEDESGVEVDYAVADDRSYVSANEARIIADLFSASPPTSAQLHPALLRAMPYIESLRYLGERATETQTLSWPRDIDEEIDGHEIDDETIPEAIKQAQVLCALRILGGDDPYGATNVSSTAASGARLTKQQVGSISQEWSYESGTSVEVSQRFNVLELLRPYLRRGALTGYGVRRV